MIKKESKNALRKKRQNRVRQSLSGTAAKPRLSVFRSSRHIYAQVIDDREGRTLLAANSLQKDVASNIKDDMTNKEIAKVVGKALAEKAKTSGIADVVFDRAGYKYHGRVAALADAAREGGLKF